MIAKQQFYLRQTDTETIEKLLKTVNEMNFDCNRFDKQDEENIRLLELTQNLSQKVNKIDLIKLKNFIDNQIKQLIELNKQNAKELQGIKLLKTATCEIRHIQTILSSDTAYYDKKSSRMYSYQSSRPYITFELDDIRKYQRQALLKSPYGTIPLYRRQAWVEIF